MKNFFDVQIYILEIGFPIGCIFLLIRCRINKGINKILDK